MSDRPTRATRAGRAYLDLQNLARRQGRPTDELHQTYALEGFLARLSHSPYAEQLVLKGGMLLAAYDTRRPTRDVDLHAVRFPHDLHAVLGIVCEIARMPHDDGLTFATETATVTQIREDAAYGGIRVTLTGRLSTTRFSFHVDVNLGDPVVPPPGRRNLPRLLGDRLELLAYPLPMVLAEKTLTAIARSSANTRLRDFADLHMLTGRHNVPGDEVRRAFTTVAAHRQVSLAALWELLGPTFAAARQPRWTAWRRRFRLHEQLPDSFTHVLVDVCRFTDPVLDDNVQGAHWTAADRHWDQAATAINHSIYRIPEHQ